jgi:elongation factor P
METNLSGLSVPWITSSRRICRRRRCSTSIRKRSYEQVFLSEEQVGEAKNFLLDNIEVEILFFEDRPLGISLPNFIDVTVTKADPWAKGDSVSGNTKPVTVQTGYELQVPPFVEEGDRIRIDTRSGEYLTRVKG